MQRSEAVVALVGALIVVVAAVGVGLGGQGTLATRGYSVLVEQSARDLPGGGLEGPAQATSTARFSFEVTEPNATLVLALPSVTYQGGVLPVSPTAFARLVAPDGNETTVETTCASGICALDPLVVLTAVPPQNFTLEASSDGEARARAEQVGPLARMINATGEWTLEVSFSAGSAPLPHSYSWQGEYSYWSARVEPVVPQAR